MVSTVALFLGDIDWKIFEYNVGVAKTLQILSEFLIALRMRTSEQGQTAA